MSLINKAHDIINKVLVDIDDKKRKSCLNEAFSKLDTRIDFGNFIEGESNKLARKVGLSIVDNISKNIYNPFFVYGQSGCGKSHLINAIGLKFLQSNPNKRVLYVNASQFQRLFVDSVCQNTTNDFIDEYQSADVLIVDDVQEWMKSPKTLETFIKIFNHLIRTDKQIIIASDRPPVALKGIKKSVLARFTSGSTVEIENPDEQLCIDIAKAKIRQVKLKIPAEVIRYIAKSTEGNVFELEGVINSLKAYSAIGNTVDISLAKRIIMRYKKTN